MTPLAFPAVAASVIGCSTSGEPEVDLSTPEPLEFVKTVAQPGHGDDPGWMSHPSRLLYDPASNTLFTREFMDAAVQEFTTDGRHVRQYGGQKGEGPGEIRNLGSFAITPEFVAIYDAGSLKIVLFDRPDGSLVREINIGRLVADMTVVGDTAIAIAPGSDNAAFDLLNLEGELLGSLGDGGFLAASSRCTCLIRDLEDGRMVIVQTSLAEGRILNLEGNLLGAFGFDRMAGVLATWSEDFRETLRQQGAAIATGAEGRISSGKHWISEVVPIGDGRFYVTAMPEKLLEIPVEVWLMDAEARVVARYAYERTLIGGYAAGFPTVYGVGISDAGVHEFSTAR